SLTALLVLVLWMASCAPAVPVSSEPPAAEAPALEAGAPAGHESPMLAEKVAAGELPPLEERLPSEPLVIEPEVAIGTYGGTVRVPHSCDKDFTVGLLRREYTDYSQFFPQVAKAWEWADDYTSMTFFLREGTQWSDGQPYTADDI